MPDTTTFAWGAALPTLHTPRLRLRHLAEADAPDLFTAFSDPDVVRYWDGRLLATLDEVRAYIAEIHRFFRRRQLFQWGVATRDAGTVIGTCTLTQYSPVHERAEIGFAIRQSHWGQGLGTEAVTALVDFAFESLGLHRLEADVDPRNERSLRLLYRLGFRREGILRARYFVNGERQDALMLALLRSEWRQPAPAPLPRFPS